jgi:hypothetical protein
MMKTLKMDQAAAGSVSVGKVGKQANPKPGSVKISATLCVGWDAGDWFIGINIHEFPSLEAAKAALPSQLRMAMAAMGQQETNVTELCRELADRRRRRACLS